MAKLLEIKELNDTNPGQPNLSVKVINNRGANIWITNYPTLNCQLFSIGSANMLKNFTPENLENFLFTIKSIVSGKYLMLADLKDRDLNTFKSTIKLYTEKIIETPYTSTNGSSMIICLVYLNGKYRDLKEDPKPAKKEVMSKKDPKELVSASSRMRGILDV